MSLVALARVGAVLVVLGAAVAVTRPVYDGVWVGGLVLVLAGGGLWTLALRERARAGVVARRGPWRSRPGGGAR